MKQALFDFVTNSAEKIIADWEFLCAETEDNYEPMLLRLEARSSSERARLPQSLPARCACSDLAVFLS